MGGNADGLAPLAPSANRGPLAEVVNLASGQVSNKPKRFRSVDSDLRKYVLGNKPVVASQGGEDSPVWPGVSCSRTGTRLGRTNSSDDPNVCYAGRRTDTTDPPLYFTNGRAVIRCQPDAAQLFIVARYMVRSDVRLDQQAIVI